MHDGVCDGVHACEVCQTAQVGEYETDGASERVREREGGRNGGSYIYIYIYIYRERERERGHCSVKCTDA